MERVAHYVFIDQHKKTSRVGIGDGQGHEMKKFDVDHREKGLGRLEKELQKLEGKVVVGLEATGFYDWMVDFLQQELKVEVKLGHPLAMKYISKAKNKTDGKDVGRGLKLLGTEQFPEAYVPTPEERELRWLLSVRERFWNLAGQIRNTIRAFLNKKNIQLPEGSLTSAKNLEALKGLQVSPVYRKTLDELVGVLEEISTRKARLEEEVERKAEADPLAEWWDGHRGIGPLTAVALRAYVAEPKRFRDRKAIGSYVGLCPRVHNSAETVQHGSIDRQGAGILRRLLVQAAHVVVRHVPEAQAYYAYLAKKRGGRRAIVAIARKLLVGLHAARRHNQKFDWARCFAIPKVKEYVLKERTTR